MLDLIMLIGIWTSACTQTQINSQKGWVKETWAIEKTGEFKFTRDWFADSHCLEESSTDIEEGTLKLGKSLTNNFFGPAQEADFDSEGSVDLGAVGLKGKTLKIARGQKNSSFRNTMLAFIGYEKQ